MLTGAFGNVGHNAIVEMLAQGHRVRAFDLYSRAGARAARRHGDQLEVIWGDIRNPRDVERAVEGVDAVAHTAFVIPPQSERRPDWAREINVMGTRNLLAAMCALPHPPRLVFTSSVSVTGPRGPEDQPPITADHPVTVSDAYTAHKIETERMVREAGLDWTILRLGAVVPLKLSRRFDPLTFDLPQDQRLELVHPRDVGLAVANAVTCDLALGRTLLIGGGETCQIRGRDLRGRIAGLLGIPTFPESAFSTQPFYIDFMDTGEAQRLLRFQRHSFDDFLADVKRRIPFFYPLLLRPFGSLIIRGLLRQSPHHPG
jgi:nucleoside-diphosphate-sugar epimerase